MQQKYDRCPNCMKALASHEDICPACQFDVAGYEERSSCLKPFTVLQNKYMIGRVIGVGGFGITYIGWDLNLQTYIAIKEYFPDSFASRDTSAANGTTQVIANESKTDVYNKGLKRYVEEAQNLSRFYQLQGIVSVKDFFYENGTGYIVMEYINGINLKQYLKNCGGRLDEATVLALMKPVLESLYEIHKAGLVHRDISPDNIMVDNTGKIKLIDFGSARGKSAETDKTYTVILKHGYAPSEQYYAKGNQGPWTDIYSLCATMYKMLTGNVPPNSVERMENDEYVSPSACGVTVSKRTEMVLAKGLAVKVADRYQDIGQLLTDLYGSAPITAGVTGMPTASAASFAAPGSQSLSQQSMHLSMIPEMNSSGTAGEKKKSKLPIIIALSVAVIALIIILAVILLRKDDGDDTPPASPSDPVTTPTDASTNTSETTTEDTSTNVPGVYIYTWPSELSDDWHDYTAMIDGTVYQFPLPYTEWAKMDWRAEVLPTYIAAGDSETVLFANDRMSVYVEIVNFSLKEAALTQCFVVGFSVDIVEMDMNKDAEVELAKGIKLKQSTEADIKAAYGAPDYLYENDSGNSMGYYTKDQDEAMHFEFNASGVLTEITIGNTQVPEGLDTQMELDTEPPVFNADYVAPTGPSVDALDRVFTTEGVSFRLPCPVSVLLELGWELDEETEDYIPAGAYNDSITTYLKKDGDKIQVELRNLSRDAIAPQFGLIYNINIETKYCGEDWGLPGGITIQGSTDSDIQNLYSVYGDAYSRDEYSSFISHSYYYYGDDGTSQGVNIYTDPETGIITDYSYHVNGYGLEQ